MTNQTTTFRKRIDFLIGCALLVKTSAETTLAWRSLQMAKAWLGKALAAMGQATPYTVADSPGKIPPTADTYEGELPETLGGLEGINYMRQKISEINLVFPQEEEQKRCYQKAADYLEEARMWYGFELANLRESNAVELPDGFKEKVNSVIDEIFGQNPELLDQKSNNLEDALNGVKWPDPLEEQQDPLPGFAKEEFDAVAPILLDDVEKIDEGINLSGKKKGKK